MTASTQRAATLLRSNRRGIAAMTIAMACFIVNDSLVKYSGQSMPTGQLIFVRGALAALLVLAVAHATGATRAIRQAAQGWVVTRAAFDAAATFAYLVSLFHLPIANATAINMASPLVITVFAVCFLRERVDWARWPQRSP